MFIFYFIWKLFNDKKEKIKLSTYYKKRYFAIFPMFYIAYIIAFIYKFWTTGGKFTLSNTSILTFLGMDGYLLYKISNPYILGEWFLGCIIILYIIFPILKKLIEKSPNIFILGNILINFIIISIYNGEMAVDRFFLVRMLDFSVGMYLMYNYNKIKLSTKKQFSLIMLIFILIWFVPNLEKYNTIKILIISILIFLIIRYISEKIKSIKINNICYYISKYSYAIFLVHYIVILEIVKHFSNMQISIKQLTILGFIIIIAVFIFAYILQKTTNKVLKSIRILKTGKI